jgi:hypothetical protein
MRLTFIKPGFVLLLGGLWIKSPALLFNLGLVLVVVLLDVYLYIVVSPPVRGFPAYLHTCICIYMWLLAPMEYNLSIPNMVSEPVLGFRHPPILCL